ncbi:hypothetical protein AB0O86_26245 [Streptomyces hirsutus]
MSGILHLLFGRQARLRWVHLVLGGALAMPYVLVGSVVIGPLAGPENGTWRLHVELPLRATA